MMRERQAASCMAATRAYYLELTRSRRASLQVEGPDYLVEHPLPQVVVGESGGVLDLHDQKANLRLDLFQSIVEACLALGLSFQTNAEIAALTLKKTK